MKVCALFAADLFMTQNTYATKYTILNSALGMK